MIGNAGHSGRFFRHGGIARLALCLSLFMLSLLPAKTASALNCPFIFCAAAEHAETQGYIKQQDQKSRDYFGTADPVPNKIAPFAQIGTAAMGADERWINDVWLRTYVVPAFQLMTEQLVTLMMNHTLAVGTMIDGKNQLSAQLLLQKMTAEAHSDYQTSTGMCMIGTGIRSLASAERTAVLTSHVLNQHALMRDLGRGEVSGAEGVTGQFGDRPDRLANFTKNFCDYEDNDRLDNKPNSGLHLICGTRPDPLLLLDLDTNYIRAVADPDSIALDMTDKNVNKPDPVVSLQKNLFGHSLVTRMTASLLKQDATHEKLVDFRSLVAKRSVAENAFASIVGLKAMGTKEGGADGGGIGSADTLKYMSVIMKDLGVPDAEMTAFLGERPSYYAQLKFLAKRIYQDPNFYIGLYDTPVNIERKKVALQAINSILEREIYNSQLRSEAIISQISEIHTAKKEAQVDDYMKSLEHTKQSTTPNSGGGGKTP